MAATTIEMDGDGSWLFGNAEETQSPRHNGDTFAYPPFLPNFGVRLKMVSSKYSIYSSGYIFRHPWA